TPGAHDRTYPGVSAGLDHRAGQDDPLPPELDREQRVSGLVEVLRGRRSVRRYTERDVPDDAVRSILESALWAPSPHNSQPWRFAVLRSAAARERLSTALGDRWRADLAADVMPADEIDRLIGRSRERIGGAPLVL